MVLFSSLSTSQITSLSWTQSNVTISGTSLTGSGSGNAYDALAFASIQSIPDIGYYVRVNFNGSGGFTYAGLSQTMTSTDAVSQGSSKIDAGFKCDNGFVLAVYNGAEFGGLLGDTTSTYEVLYDGEKYMYFVNGVYSGVSRGAPAKNLNGYRVATAFYDSTSVTITAGTYAGSPIPQPPGEPENISVDIGIPGEMTVTWNPPSYNGGGISYYKVKYVSVDDPDTIIAQTTIAVNLERSHTFTNVGANKEYIVRVIAFNNTEQPGPTASVSLTTPGWGTEPQDISVDIGIPGEMTVTWNPPSYNNGGISYYKVKYVSVDDPDTIIAQTTIAVNLERSHTFTNVSANKEYIVRVIAFNNTEQPGQTASVSLTTPGWETQPRDISVDIGIPGQMTVTWNPPSYNFGSISYYKVKYVSVDDPDTTIAETTIAVNLERSHTFTNVGANKEYIVRVIAFNNTEQPGQTASVSLTTPGWAGPSEVRNLVVTSTQKNTIDITWDSPVSTGLSSETFTKYRIFFLNIAGVDINILVDHEAGKTTGYTYSIPDQYSGIYFLQIAAINGENIEGNVAARTVQVESEPPLPVTNIAADNSVPGKLTVTWEIDQTPPVALRFMVIATDSLGNQVPIIVENTNSAELTLNAETYSIEITAITGLGGTAPSNGPAGVVVAPDSGGGGGGGGGGNNGGNGHNNMATLEYNYPSWAATVTQTNSITVLGEDSAAITADETIVINVPLAQLKECIVYESQWTTSDDGAGGPTLPKVEFRPSETYAAKSELDAMFAELKALGTGTVGNRTFDDDASATHDQFGKILINDVTFTGSVFDSQDLPKVAIRSVVEGAISVNEVTETVVKRNTVDHAGHKSYLEALFEQLVAADRIKKDDATSANNAAFGACKVPTLQAGDSLSFLVTYTFTKTREYEVDGLDAGNGNNASKALTLTIGGSTFTIQPGPDGSETSNNLVKTYAFKMVATA